MRNRIAGHTAKNIYKQIIRENGHRKQHRQVLVWGKSDGALSLVLIINTIQSNKNERKMSCKCAGCYATHTMYLLKEE